MRRIKPVVPQKSLTRPLYELLRSLDQTQVSSSLAAVERGENPAGGGPLVNLTNYFYLPGRLGGQVAHGATEGSGNLTLSSTAAGTKGKIYFGDVLRSAFDETNDALGLFTTSPQARLHVIGRAGGTFLGSSDSGVNGWGLYGSGAFATVWQSIQTNDGTVSFIGRHMDVGTFNTQVILNGTVSTSTPTYTITYVARYEGTAPITGTTYSFGLSRSDGIEGVSLNLDATLLTTTFATYTTTISSFTGGAVAANRLRINAIIPGGNFADGYIEITYVTVSASVGATGLATAIFQTQAGQTDFLTAWRNDTGTNLITLSASGLFKVESGGTFQYVPGAAANTTFIGDSTGLAAWIKPNLLSVYHGDTTAGTVVRGDLITGQGASPTWARLAKGSANQILGMDGTATDVIWLTQPTTFLDSVFRIKDDGDTTKQLAFEVSGITTGTTRTLTVQNASGTLPLLESAQTFTTIQTIAPLTDVIPLKIVENPAVAPSSNFCEFYIGTNRPGHIDNIGGWNSAYSTPLTYWDGGQSGVGDIITTEYQQWNGKGGLTINVPWVTGSSNTQNMVLSGVPATITNKTVSNGTSVTTAALGVDTGATPLTLNPNTTGVYIITVFAMCTALDAGAGNLTVTIGWTDTVGATTQAACVLPLTATGRISGQVILKRASGSVTYAATASGTYGSARYILAVRISGLG